MKKTEVIVEKMKVENGETVQYYIESEHQRILVNSLLNTHVTISFLNKISCLKCGVGIKKTYAQGYCYPCFISIPETEDCVLNPEKCQAHLGIARDMAFAEKHCLQPHIVYLAISSGLKVGVTRMSQIPVRWIDQGAISAIKFAQTPNRFTAGLIEVELKKFVSDKTNWRNMLTNKIDTIDLTESKKTLGSKVSNEFQNYINTDDEVYNFNYPVHIYPEKVMSIDIDKIGQISGLLTGIKGQYLIFDQGRVINLRKYGGYRMSIEY